MSKKESRLKIFSALEVANMCGVVNQTAINWIKNGYLKAFTTPGGQYRIYAENLVAFLMNRGMKIPEALLPYVKENPGRKKKIVAAAADSDFLALLREKIFSGSPDCDFFAASSPLEAGMLMAKEEPDFIIITDSFADTTPEKVKQLFGSSERGKKQKDAKGKIIYIKSYARDDDSGKGADLTLLFPPDFSRLLSFIRGGAGA